MISGCDGAATQLKVVSAFRAVTLSLRESLTKLGEEQPGLEFNSRRLCAVSLSAGRVIGYLEALELIDRKLAESVAYEALDVIRTLEIARLRFESAES